MFLQQESIPLKLQAPTDTVRTKMDLFHTLHNTSKTLTSTELYLYICELISVFSTKAKLAGIVSF